MNAPGENQSPKRLSRLSQTRYGLFHEAHESRGSEADVARRKAVFWEKYDEALRRYISGCLKDDWSSTDEVYSEVKEKFFEGKFRGFDERKGLFRRYLKAAVSNTLIDYYRREKRASAIPGLLRDAIPDSAEALGGVEFTGNLEDSIDAFIAQQDRAIGENFERIALFRLRDENNRYYQFWAALQVIESRELPLGARMTNQLLMERLRKELGDCKILRDPQAFSKHMCRVRWCFWFHFLDAVVESNRILSSEEALRDQIVEMGRGKQVFGKIKEKKSIWDRWKQNRKIEFHK